MVRWWHTSTVIWLLHMACTESFHQRVYIYIWWNLSCIGLPVNWESMTLYLVECGYFSFGYIHEQLLLIRKTCCWEWATTHYATDIHYLWLYIYTNLSECTAHNGTTKAKGSWKFKVCLLFCKQWSKILQFGHISLCFITGCLLGKEPYLTLLHHIYMSP